MEKNRIILVVVLLCLGGTVVQAANTIYVDANSPNDPGSGTFEDPFRRIQDGINITQPGDSVLIRRGIYTGIGNYDLDPNGKSITISSTNPEDIEVVANTVIDPNRAGRGFYIHSNEDANCTILGLTIKNAYTNDLGAGIYCYKSNPAIVNCILIDNYTELYGGAIGCEDSNSLIKNCTITGNNAYDGGGVECWSASPRMINCTISNNRVTRYGGGVDCYNTSNPNLSNCSLVDNKTATWGEGGAISLWGSGMSIKNSILWANDANNGAQLYLHFESSISVSYCDVQGGISDVCAPGSVINWVGGNIDSDPCFASFDLNGDPNLWDFHLKSTSGRWDAGIWPDVDLTQNGFVDLLDFTAFAEFWNQHGEGIRADFDNSSEVDIFDLWIMSEAYLKSQSKGKWVYDEVSSSCLDAGDPNSDWTTEPWPNGKRINMGAYGGTGQASKSGNIADLNIDGRVNFFDLAELGNLWGASQETIKDLDKSGTVDIGDFDIMAENWLWEKQ